MSDIGRTLTGNGGGSDHAWGGSLLLLGDAVRGNQLYRSYPRLVVNASTTREDKHASPRRATPLRRRS